MASIKITYRLSAAGQKASLLAGGDGKAVQACTLTPASPEWSEAVELAAIGADGDGKIEIDTGRGAYRRFGGEVNYDRRDYPRYDAPTTAVQLLADYRREKALDDEGAAAYREEQAAKEEAEVQRVLTCHLSDLIDPNYWSGTDHPAILKSSPWSDPRTADRKAEAEAEVARINAAAKAAIAAAEAEKKAALGTLAAWTREHGSELARLRLEGGYDCWVSSARTEYADAVATKIAEASGLTLDDGDLYERCDSVKTEDRKCPTVAEIKALREVKAALPAGCAAKLVWSRYTGDDLDEGIGRAEIEITIPVPGAGDETRTMTISE